MPAAESQGRIHTSTCTVAVLVQAEDVELKVPETELRIDTYQCERSWWTACYCTVQSVFE